MLLPLQNLLALGEEEGVGAEVVSLVAGAEGARSPGLSRLFAPEELRQLLELERRATIHAMGPA